ncbi:MAG TPA: hypothetical protein VEQ60_15660 [Longimicrobium sp.]|nr:hypothetical protein [Longimicrobium sp.]
MIDSDHTRPGEAMWQAIHAARPGGSVGYVGVARDGCRAMDERRAIVS